MKKFLPVILLALVVLPLIASAATDPQSVLCSIFAKVKLILFVVGLGLAVIFLIVGGIKYMTSQGDDEKAGSAKKMIVNALIGVAIIAVAVGLISLVIGFLGGNGIEGLFDFTNLCPTL
jgi:hypothetical protein